MRSFTAIILFLFLFGISVHAQEQMPPPSDPKPPKESSEPGPPHAPKKDKFWDANKITVGGMLSVNFGSYTYFDIAPTIGYKFTKRYEAGVGPVYMYFGPPYDLSIYGGTVYNRLYLADFIFLHAMYQPLNGPWDPYINERFWLNNVWVGGGIKQGVGKGGIFLMALVNINQTNFDFPHSPWFAVGFMF